MTENHCRWTKLTLISQSTKPLMFLLVDKKKKIKIKNCNFALLNENGHLNDIQSSLASSSRPLLNSSYSPHIASWWLMSVFSSSAAVNCGSVTPKCWQSKLMEKYFLKKVSYNSGTILLSHCNYSILTSILCVLYVLIPLSLRAVS